MNESFDAIEKAELKLIELMTDFEQHLVEAYMILSTPERVPNPVKGIT
jgi:hypothetical protein